MHKPYVTAMVDFRADSYGGNHGPDQALEAIYLVGVLMNRDCSCQQGPVTGQRRDYG